ncbi:hypothetical protein GCM10009863_05500 [Streptomyces axinellae]|uniref:Ester cyclase n=2 Tax=Streptomyces axinellae TaxID=552788 RepID=A0ABN3PQ94_9ACTN
MDELNRLMDAWVEATQGKRTATHSVVGRDRADSTHVVEIVEFPSHEEAMQNSHLPETEGIFREMLDLCEGEPSFTDLDVMRDEQLNKIVVRSYFEDVINPRNIDGMDGMCTCDYREHSPAMSSYDLGLAQAKAETKEITAALRPELTVESMVAEGEMVCVRLSVKGRHVGTFAGVEATGKEISGTGQITFRCEGGRLAESWWNMDERGVLEQVGALKG